MSQILKTILIPESNGSGAIFNDVTGSTGDDSYGKVGSLDYNQVGAIGIKMATYTTLSNIETLKADDSLIQYKEYVKIGGGSSTINDKVFTIGQFFTGNDQESYVVPAGDIWKETGYYVYPFLSTWLPTSNQVQLNISLQKLNQIGLEISDDIYAYTYEIYQTNGTTNGSFNSISGAKYLVTEGTVTYNGNYFYPGDTFIAELTGYPITVTSGHCYQMFASVDAYSVIDYNTRQRLYQLVMEKTGSTCAKCWSKISKMVTQLDSIGFMSSTGDVAMGPASETLKWVNDEITNFQSCNC